MSTPAAFLQLPFADYLDPKDSIPALAASSRLMLALSPWLAARAEPVDRKCLDIYLKFAPLPMGFCQRLDLSIENILEDHEVLSPDLSPRLLQSILHRCPDLQVLKLRSNDCSDWWIGVTDEHVAVLAAASLWCLRELELSRSHVTDDGLKMVSQKCKQLQSLDLFCCQNISDNGLKMVSDGCKALRSINLSCCQNISDNGLKMVSDGCKALQSLNLSHCQHISDAGVRFLSEGCAWLTDVNLFDSSAVIHIYMGGNRSRQLTVDLLTSLPQSLKGLHPDVDKLSRLSRLSRWSLALCFNEISGTPDLTRLPESLQELRLDHNKLSGTVDLTRLPQSLQLLRLDHNKLSGTVDLTRLPQSLQELLLHDNQLSGTPDLTKLPLSLYGLYLSDNLLSGTPVLTNLPQSLRRLRLDNNQLSGTPDLTNLPESLEMLKLNGNALDGFRGIHLVTTVSP